jgi:hypothetical protein
MPNRERQTWRAGRQRPVCLRGQGGLTVHARQGAVTRGQKPSKRGYLFGFGIAEESYRIMIYATAAHGLPTDGPFDEDTGLGFVPQRSGH